MKFKSILRVVICGISLGFIYGLIKAIQIISSQKYIHYKLHNSTLSALTGNINRGVVYGLIIVIFVYLFIKIISFIWIRLFAPFLEVKVSKKKNLVPLIKGVSFGIIFIYLLFQILKFAQSPNHNFKFLLGQLLLVFLLFFLFLQFEKMNLSRIKSRLRSILPAGIKITSGSLLSLFILINILFLGVKLFNHPSGPNILLIVPDALRADHLGCYGYNRLTSPQIDKFAADSLIFENAWSNSPWTKPSMGTVFTSLYPHEHQAFCWKDSLPDACLTLAEVFRNQNYNTFAIQTNPSITRKHDFNQGFLYYKEMDHPKGEVVTSNFITWIEKHSKKPFFAYLHYMDTHAPYNAPKDFSQIFGLENNTKINAGEFKTIDIRILSEIGFSQEYKNRLINLYDGAVKYFDYNFEKIIDNLKKLGIFDKTVIIIVSDHGEEFWEHGSYAHGHTLYNEILRVPLIIRYSSHLPSKRIKSHVQLLDLFPTVMSTMRTKNDFNLKGKDLISSVLNNKRVDEEIFFEGVLFGAEAKGILKDGWKLIENTGKKNEGTLDLLGGLMKFKHPEYKRGFELYNINQDFSEKINLIDEHPQITNKLKKLLLTFRTSLLDSSLQVRTKLKEKLKDLKSLGYIK